MRTGEQGDNNGLMMVNILKGEQRKQSAIRE